MAGLGQWLVAGVSGGGSICRSGDFGNRSKRGWSRWNSCDVARPTVAVAGAEVPCSGDGDEVQRRQEHGLLGCEASVRRGAC